MRLGYKNMLAFYLTWLLLLYLSLTLMESGAIL